MPAITLGGGSSAVAASSHAACARFRGTDPMITNRTRRQLARDLGRPDTSGTIPDARLLKGYLQVAFGAEAVEEWSQRPAGLDIHRYGVLAVPKNAFLQPHAIVEDLKDHREEVRARLAERRREADGAEWTSLAVP